MTTNYLSNQGLLRIAMQRTYIREAEDSKGKKVLLKGWVHEMRDQSKVKFILLRDNTGIVQLVVKGGKLFDNFHTLAKESAIAVKGEVKEASVNNPEVTAAKAELIVEDYMMLSGSEKELPIQVVKGKDTADLSVRLDWRCLDLRKPRNLAIFKIESALLNGMKEFLEKQDFVQVFTPSLMAVPSESGSEMFEVRYFDRKAFLRQDPQLHRQLTIAGGIEKLYDIGPSWRAELSHTTKHLCEHRVCAAEFAFIEDEMDVIKLQENLVVSALQKVNEKCGQELELLGVKLEIPKTPFPELRFPKIYGILEEYGKNIRGEDLDAEAEKILGEYVQKKFNSEFYFFNRFPSKIKPFYVMKVEGDEEYARSVDLNWRGMELSSGGQREHRHDVLMKQVKEKGLNPASVEWFTKFFRYGVPPHGGFAIGVERITQALLGLLNIREAALFPRDTERLEP